ncbi:MAG TPA: hypothetical protein VG963_06715 [Polyangiaceae bacterium]|nr:hypothetical protein [Polyangiaceae bacterium]
MTGTVLAMLQKQVRAGAARDQLGSCLVGAVLRTYNHSLHWAHPGVALLARCRAPALLLFRGHSGAKSLAF